MLGQIFSASTVIATLAGLLPWIAACIGGFYYCLMVYENKSVQMYLHTRRLRKIAYMKTRIAKMEAMEKAHKLYDDEWLSKRR